MRPNSPLIYQAALFCLLLAAMPKAFATESAVDPTVTPSAGDAATTPAQTQSSPENSEAYQQELATCQSQLAIVQEACAIRDPSGNIKAAENVSGMGQSAAAQQLSDGYAKVEKQAAQLNANCKAKAQTCNDACTGSRRRLSAGGQVLDLNAFVSIGTQCVVASNKHAKVMEPAGKDAKDNKETSQNSANQAAYQPPKDSTTTPVASSGGGEIVNSGGNPFQDIQLPVVGAGQVAANTGAINQANPSSIPQGMNGGNYPTKSPSASTSESGSSDPLDQAVKEKDDGSSKKSKLLQSLFGGDDDSQLMQGLTGGGGTMAMNRARQLLEALTGKKAPVDGRTNASAANVAYNPERGQSGYARKAAATQVAARNTPVAITETSRSGSRGLASASGATPIAQTPNAGWNPNGNGTAEASAGQAAASARELQYASLNNRMRMQAEDGGGGGGGAGMRPAALKNVPLSEYLPTGQMYRGRVGGQQQEALGIQNAHTDIWGLISKRMRIRCNDGRLKDCR